MGNVWAKTTRPDTSDDAMITNGEQYLIPLPDEHDFPMAFEDEYRGNATSHELLTTVLEGQQDAIERRSAVPAVNGSTLGMLNQARWR